MQFHHEAIRKFRESAARKHIAFRFRPVDAETISQGMVNMTCRLDLTGRHSNRLRTDEPCMDCAHTLEALFDVLDVLRDVERDTLKTAGGKCKSRAHYAAADGQRHEVLLGIEIGLQHPLETVAGHWTWIFMQRARTELIELGCQDLGSAELIESNLSSRAVCCEDAKSAPAVAA